MCFRFAKGSRIWLIVAASAELLALAFFFNFMDNIFVGVLFFMVTLAVAMVVWFFRDPDREIGMGVVAPADGVVTGVEERVEADVGGTSLRIVIFMNVHNVHVNRIPLAGTVLSTTHHPGSHIPAFSKDSERNERQVTVLETEIGRMKLVQIAGTVARRIVPYIEKGDVLAKGERLGIILFGSRVDLYLPAGRVRVVARKGDRMKAGESTVVELVSGNKAQDGGSKT